MIKNKKIEVSISRIVKKIVSAYAYGKSDRDSDIDILIIKNTDERPIDRRVRIRRIISNPKQKVPFETIVLTTKELRERIY